MVTPSRGVEVAVATAVTRLAVVSRGQGVAKVTVGTPVIQFNENSLFWAVETSQHFVTSRSEDPRSLWGTRRRRTLGDRWSKYCRIFVGQQTGTSG